jgi:hypothetical protein
VTSETASRNGVRFCMRDCDRTVACRVTCEALEDIAGAHQPGFDHLAAFEANRGQIESVARRIYKARKVDLDGVVLVRSADFAENWRDTSLTL